MRGRREVFGRDAERALLGDALADASRGVGSLVLLAGDAGVGKTALADAVAGSADTRVLRGAATQGMTTPYAPMVAALRGFLRAAPDGFAAFGPLHSHLALLLPELGSPPPVSDRPTMFEAIRCALASIADETSALLILDDLQWSDEATLEFLAALAGPLDELPIVVLAA